LGAVANDGMLAFWGMGEDPMEGCWGVLIYDQYELVFTLVKIVLVPYYLLEG
jgi:ABC-type dipeptide/oligopeptide/nickel transport system permease subunit